MTFVEHAYPTSPIDSHHSSASALAQDTRDAMLDFVDKGPFAPWGPGEAPADWWPLDLLVRTTPSPSAITCPIQSKILAAHASSTLSTYARGCAASSCVHGPFFFFGAGGGCRRGSLSTSSQVFLLLPLLRKLVRGKAIAHISRCIRRPLGISIASCRQ